MIENQDEVSSNIVHLDIPGRIVDGHCTRCHFDVSFVIPLIKECGMSRPQKCPEETCRAQLIDSDMAVTEIILSCTNCSTRLNDPYPEKCPGCSRKLNYSTVKKKKLPVEDETERL